MDAQKNVALLFVSHERYYKLPGGGIEEGEDKLEALARECREEIGCDIAVTGEVGVVVERRRFKTLNQASYCYLASVVGEKGAPAFTQSENEHGFKIVWLPYEEALRALEESRTLHFEGSTYIVARDTALLKAAGSLLELTVED